MRQEQEEKKEEEGPCGPLPVSRPADGADDRLRCWCFCTAEGSVASTDSVLPGKAISVYVGTPILLALFFDVDVFGRDQPYTDHSENMPPSLRQYLFSTDIPNTTSMEFTGTSMPPLVQLGKKTENYEQVTPEEDERFLTLVQNSDYAEVEKMLSMSCVDINLKGRLDGIETTALDTASVNNDFYMVKLLLDHGAEALEDKPPKDNEERTKVQHYSALSSPAYISLSYLRDKRNGENKKNCLEVAFELEHKLSIIVNEESSPTLKEEYQKLQQQLQAFTLELLNCCRDEKEIPLLLRGHNNTEEKQKCRLDFLSNFTYDYNSELTVAKLAIGTKQKEFITHNKCQAFLNDEWLSGQPAWTNRKRRRWAFLYAMFSFFAYGILPIIIPIHLFLSVKNTTKKCLYHSPISSYLSYYFTYFFFLAFMFIYEIEVDVTVEGSAATLISDYNYLPILCMSIIFFATLSMIELSQMLSQGWTRYSQNHWNKLDLYILLSFFLSTIFVYPVITGQQYDFPHVSVLFSKLTTITFVLAILRFAEPLYLTRYLGPMLIVVAKVVNSVIRFLLIFWLVVVAYALALYHLYADVGTSHEGLSELLTSIWVLLITIFGGDGSELLYTDDWMSMNVTGIQSSYTSFTSPYYSFVAYVLYSLFGILVLIILLNLCIAMMSYDYEKVRDKMELEWKFIGQKYG
ncbi:short transient receptor potential channel 4-like [Ptychodera flava]|uniref:short transient receptor potential channel 4-like n=1 Tax=Ptychodera flava TaxID=63121 RepID=UPI003969F524